MHYIIGVDGGGTKTEAVAFSMNGDVIFKNVTGFGNVLVDETKALENIIEAIGGCIKGVYEKNRGIRCIFICAGLAGVEVGNYSIIIKQKIEDYFKVRTKVVNDAVIAHASLLKGEDGIITISGTGSISIGKRENEIVRAGGWGHILGDEGSGYHIALKALKKAVNEYDMGCKESPLTLNIMKKLNIKRVEEIKDFVYQSDKASIAALVPVIVESSCYDLYAKQILIDAANDLSEITYMVANKLNMFNNVKIGIKGSVLTKVDIVRENFEKILSRKLKKVDLIDEDVPSSKGAFYLALLEYSKLAGDSNV